MAYKCLNKDCIKFLEVVNPGGKIIIKDGNPFFTGSLCSVCGKEMTHMKNKMGDFKQINNKGDGRNL